MDGSTGFIGGINVSDDYSSSSFGIRIASASESPERQKNWRDTHLRVDGPVVHALQALFLRTWQSLPGNEPAPHMPYPPLQSVGTALVRPVASTGGDGEDDIHATYLSAIRHARERVWLTHAYFSPDSTLLEALMAAARRGVDVRIVLPQRSDASLVLYASQAHFSELMAVGVKLYRRTGTVLHAKTGLVDGYWSIAGSANLDPRSLIHNHEAVAVVVSRELAQEMAHLFERDLEHAQVVDPKAWARRGPWQRLMEFVASRFDYWL